MADEEDVVARLAAAEGDVEETTKAPEASTVETPPAPTPEAKPVAEAPTAAKPEPTPAPSPDEVKLSKAEVESLRQKAAAADTLRKQVQEAQKKERITAEQARAAQYRDELVAEGMTVERANVYAQRQLDAALQSAELKDTVDLEVQGYQRKVAMAEDLHEKTGARISDLMKADSPEKMRELARGHETQTKESARFAALEKQVADLTKKLGAPAQTFESPMDSGGTSDDALVDKHNKGYKLTAAEKKRLAEIHDMADYIA